MQPGTEAPLAITSGPETVSRGEEAIRHELEQQRVAGEKAAADERRAQQEREMPGRATAFEQEAADKRRHQTWEAADQARQERADAFDAQQASRFPDPEAQARDEAARLTKEADGQRFEEEWAADLTHATEVLRKQYPEAGESEIARLADEYAQRTADSRRIIREGQAERERQEAKVYEKEYEKEFLHQIQSGASDEDAAREAHLAGENAVTVGRNPHPPVRDLEIGDSGQERRPRGTVYKSGEQGTDPQPGSPENPIHVGPVPDLDPDKTGDLGNPVDADPALGGGGPADKAEAEREKRQKERESAERVEKALDREDIQAAIDELAKREQRYENQAGKWRRGEGFIGRTGKALLGRFGVGKQKEKRDAAYKQLAEYIKGDDTLSEAEKKRAIAKANLQVGVTREGMSPKKDIIYKLWHPQTKKGKVFKVAGLVLTGIGVGLSAAATLPFGLTIAGYGLGWVGAGALKAGTVAFFTSSGAAGLNRRGRAVQRGETLAGREATIESLLASQNVLSVGDYAQAWNELKLGGNPTGGRGGQFEGIEANRTENNEERRRMQKKAVKWGLVGSLAVGVGFHLYHGDMSGWGYTHEVGPNVPAPTDASHQGNPPAGGDQAGNTPSTGGDHGPGGNTGGNTQPTGPSGAENGGNLSQAQIDNLRHALATPNDPNSQALLHQYGIDGQAVAHNTDQLVSHYKGDTYWGSYQAGDHLSDAATLHNTVGTINDLARHGIDIKMEGPGQWTPGHGGPTADLWKVGHIQGQVAVVDAQGHVQEYFNFTGTPDPHQLAALTNASHVPGNHIVTVDDLAKNLGSGDSHSAAGTAVGGNQTMGAAPSASVDGNHGAQQPGVGGEIARDIAQQTQAQSYVDQLHSQLNASQSVDAQQTIVRNFVNSHADVVHGYTTPVRDWFIQHIMGVSKLNQQQIAALLDAAKDSA